MIVHTNEREEACRTYYHRARNKHMGPKGGLDRQFFADGLRDVWTSFDALLALKFHAGANNKDRRHLFCDKHERTFPEWHKSDQLRKSIEILIKLSPVTNMENGKQYSIINKDNLKEILDFTYAVRGNLDHGAKDLESNTNESQRNRDLIEFSFNTAFEILEKAIELEGIMI